MVSLPQAVEESLKGPVESGKWLVKLAILKITRIWDLRGDAAPVSPDTYLRVGVNGAASVMRI